MAERIGDLQRLQKEVKAQGGIPVKTSGMEIIRDSTHFVNAWEVRYENRGASNVELNGSIQILPGDSLTLSSGGRLKEVAMHRIRFIGATPHLLSVIFRR